MYITIAAYPSKFILLENKLSISEKTEQSNRLADYGKTFGNMLCHRFPKFKIFFCKALKTSNAKMTKPES